MYPDSGTKIAVHETGSSATLNHAAIAVRLARHLQGASMDDPQLFTHIDTAFRAIALLALCAAPFFLPVPASLSRRIRALSSRHATRPRSAPLGPR